MPSQPPLEPFAGAAQPSARARLVSPRFAATLLLLVMLWEFLALLSKASTKNFWCDELITLHILALQSFSRVWGALLAGADGASPGYYLIMRLARMLPGDPFVTFRLPSILGYVLTLAGVYWFARRRLPVSAGVTAALLIALSPFRDYAVDARCYSMLVGLLAVSAALWQRIGEKRFLTPLFALVLTLGVSTHYLAVIAIPLFGLAELTRTVLSRRIRWGIWASCLLAACPFMLSFPILRHYRDMYGRNYLEQLGWGTAISTYQAYTGIAPILLLVLVVFLGMLLAGRLLEAWRRRAAEAADIVLIGGFLFYPVLLVAITKLQHGGYMDRYGWPAVLGLVLALQYSAPANWLKSSSAFLLASLLMAFTVQGIRDFTLPSGAEATRVDTLWTGLAELIRNEPDIPVVIASPVRFVAASEYAPPELRDRLVMIDDADTAARLIGTDTLDKQMAVLARFTPLRLEAPVPFQAAHQRFIVYSGGDGDWITPYLLAKQYRLILLSHVEKRAVYLAER
jgi:hypothetical protein